MDRLRAFRDGITDESLRFAVLVGLATVPLTVALSWEPVADGSTIAGVSLSGTPLLMAALVVGYVYSRRETATSVRRAGVWTGLAGSLATVVLAVANTVATLGTSSTTVATLAVVATPFALAFGVGLTVLVTAVAATVAGWATKRASREYRIRESTDVERSGLEAWWWLPVVAYVVLAPPVFVGFTLEPDGALLLVFVLSMIGLALLSLPAFLALFVDATAPRDASTWLPNVWRYVGVPLATYGLVYAGAAVRSYPGPSGPATFAFLVALWVTVLYYLANRYRYFDPPSAHPRSTD
ncbi:hypothetical protein [Natronococcus sp.]|uniref:hypothetical protein n=1 Tax=Natronococcus sp. TaxID=35747 RepID=UPI0025E248A5|nr:hypothetical protein [Natronococcus sp.]